MNAKFAATINRLFARQQVIEAAVTRLIQLAAAADPAAARRLAEAIRLDTAELLQQRAGGARAEEDADMTLLLASLLAAAGHPPSR